ncbi:DUF1178 family protein [Pleomorphomonas koreensis]|uniref:DUF1178 family protein n=1 Tax=Pleomorphomonas koreensis TaxID=257440 RepID=UPI00047AAEDD|nr:DUF1178 family protein [Pleomorphomonas koreensis]
MIRYSLLCSEGHEFEGWFRSSRDFDAQASAGLCACPRCGSTSVAKALMKPNVATSEARTAPVAEQGMPPSAIPPEARAFIGKLKEIKAALLDGSEDVGKRFAEEARRIHFGEAPARAVHGEATEQDARALVEDGIDILPLPILPGERN